MKKWLLLLQLSPLFAWAQMPADTLRKDSTLLKMIETEKQVQQHNALPYLQCPLTIRFEPYDSVAGYILMFDTNHILYTKIGIFYPQYHYVIYEACNWPKGLFTCYLYSIHGTLLNKFQVQNLPFTGKSENVGPFVDLRKIKKKKKRK